MTERIVVWRVSAAGEPCICGTYAHPLYFPLYRVGEDAWTPLALYRCPRDLPPGAEVYPR